MIETFYLIMTKTKNNKKIYLGADGDGFAWTFDFNDGLWFNTPSEAEKFAKGYFKNFSKWQIIEMDYEI